MALTDQPYLPLYVDDWMNNSKLKLCSPGAHGLMISIMCLMHKSDEYGVILLRQTFRQTEQQEKNFAAQLAKLSSFDLPDVEKFFKELLYENVLCIEGEKLICPRMVNDAKLSKTRALSGRKGAKTTNKRFENVAAAKHTANTGIEYVNENEYENEYVSDNEKEGMGEKTKKRSQKKVEASIPEFSEFLKTALEKNPLLDEEAVKLKYDAWVNNGWKNGNDKIIKNWKSALYNTIPYLKTKHNGAQTSNPAKVAYRFNLEQAIAASTTGGNQ